MFDMCAGVCDRSAVAHSDRAPGTGNPAHIAGDVQLPASPHPDPLPRPAAESSVHPGLHTAGKPEPAAPLVSSLRERERERERESACVC